MWGRIRNLINEVKWEVLVALAFVPLFWILMDWGYLNDAETVQPVMIIILCSLMGVLIFMALCGQLTWKRTIVLITLAGLVMRMGYALSTNTYIRHHDYGDLAWYVYGHAEWLEVHDYGHAPYIMSIYLNRTLAPYNVGQFYHPPLFHILAAVSMRLTSKVLKIEDLFYLFEASKIVSCIASCYTLLLTGKICRELEITKAAKAIAIGMIAFLPIFYLLAGWVNNDSLAVFFMALILLYTIRWYRDQTWMNTLILALAFGFGMMTKISCGLLAFFTGAVMLYRLVQNVKAGTWKNLTQKILGFGVLACPVGLAYPIRNYLLFRQPLNYVLRLDVEKVKEEYSFFQRFLGFPVSRIFDPVFADSSEYNLNLFLLKTSSFGEFSYAKELEPWAILILAANLVLILSAVCAAVFTCIRMRNEKSFLLQWAMPGFWILSYVSELIFSVTYPYTCTMDARYIVPVIIIGSMYLGLHIKYRLERPRWYGNLFIGICGAAVGVLGFAGMYMFTHL